MKHTAAHRLAGRKPGILAAAAAVLLPLLALSPAGAQETHDFNYINSPITEAILPLYEELTGKKLILDSAVAQAQITITSIRALAADEAIPFIEASFLLNGYAIVPVDDRTAKVVVASGKPPITVSDVGVYVDAANLPEEEKVVAFVMLLKYITPDEAVRTFQAVARPSQQLGGSISAVPNASAVIIIDNTPLIRTLVKLKEHIDKPSDQVTTESIQLQRADAETVAASLNEIIQAQSSQRGGSSGGRAVVATTVSANAVGGGGGGSGPALAPDGNTVHIIAINRTNSVLVIARPVDVEYIKKLIEHFDAPSQVDNFLKRELKYLSIADFMPVAENALSRYIDEGSSGGGLRSGGAANRTTGSNRTNNNRSTGSNNNNRSGGANSTFGGGGGGGIGGGNLGDPQALGGPESILIGNTLLIGDSQLNNIIVSGPPEHLRIIDQLLDEIDIRPRQVYISAVIAQVTLGDEIRTGWDLLRTVDSINIGSERVNIAGLYRNTTSGPGIIDPLDLTTAGDFPTTGTGAASGLNVWAQVGSFLYSYVQALEATSRFQVISRPFVFTANNQRANIASGERVAVPTQTVSSVTNNDTVNSSIGFEEVLLQLEVIPLINSKDEVTLEISQENENITDFTTISNNRVPNIATQQLNTTVRLPNKGIVVLGGIIQEEERKNANGLPFFTRIPIIKNITGSTSKTTDRRELLIFLQPHIIEGGDDLVDANIKAVSGTIVGKDAVEATSPVPEQHPALFPESDGRGHRARGDSGILIEEQAVPGSTVLPPGIDDSSTPTAPVKRKSLLKRLFRGSKR